MTELLWYLSAPGGFSRRFQTRREAQAWAKSAGILSVANITRTQPVPDNGWRSVQRKADALRRKAIKLAERGCCFSAADANQLAVEHERVAAQLRLSAISNEATP